jgi:hypothetical protein
MGIEREREDEDEDEDVYVQEPSNRVFLRLLYVFSSQQSTELRSQSPLNKKQTSINTIATI